MPGKFGSPGEHAQPEKIYLFRQGLQMGNILLGYTKSVLLPLLPQGIPVSL
jgi:hypothetical protein